MRRFLFVAFALMICVASAAQDNNKLESYLQYGGGLFLESGRLSQNPGIVLGLSYGLDIRFNEQWSIMPGMALRAQLTPIYGILAVGGDNDGMSIVDLFVTARYHILSEDPIVEIGMGPSLSYMLTPATYYIDADPSDPLNHKEKFKRFDLGLRPSLVVHGKKRSYWGLEANIGLLNAYRQYPEYNHTGSMHLHFVAITRGWHF